MDADSSQSDVAMNKKELISIDGELHYECGRCREVKPISEFFKSKILKSGFDSYCKICRKICTRKSEKKVRAYKKNKICLICKLNCDGTLLLNKLPVCFECGLKHAKEAIENDSVSELHARGT